MKKIRLLFIFAIGLIFISSFSSCDSPVEKGDIIIERVENNWLVLGVDNITKESYSNPQNLFLTGIDEFGGKTNDYCRWYKNINGKYELVSINFTPSNALLTGFVYKIKDTVNVDGNFYSKNNLYNKDSKGFKILAKAYTNSSSELIKRSYKNHEYLAKYFWIIAKTNLEDSVVKYVPEKKSFAFISAKPIIKNRFDPTLMIFILLSLFLTFSIARIENCKYDRIENAKIARKQLFWILFVCNTAFACLWLGWRIIFSNLVAIILGTLIIAGVFYLLFSLVIVPITNKLYYNLVWRTWWGQAKCIDEVNKIYLSLIISVFVFLNIFLIFAIPLNLSLILALIIFLPALPSLIKILIWFTREINRRIKCQKEQQK